MTLDTPTPTSPPPAAGGTADRQRMVSHLLIAVLCAGLGYAIIIQVQRDRQRRHPGHRAARRIWSPSSTASTAGATT